MLRILIADRTPLHDLEGLRTCAEQGEMLSRQGNDSDMAFAALASAKAFRALPAVRSMLWGVEGAWTDVRLESTRTDIETDLKTHLEQNGSFVALAPTLHRAIKRILEPDSPGAVFGASDHEASAAGMAAHGARGVLSPECRVVVRDADVRGCLRAAFPAMANPIITEFEREVGAALNGRRPTARGDLHER